MTRRSKAAQQAEKLAEHVASEAQKEGVAFPDKIKALQAVTGYYAATTRATRKGEAEEDDGPTFDKFRDSVNGISNTTREQ